MGGAFGRGKTRRVWGDCFNPGSAHRFKYKTTNTYFYVMKYGNSVVRATVAEPPTLYFTHVSVRRFNPSFLSLHTQVIFGLFMGRAADLYNRKLIVFYGLVIWNVATIALGLSSNFWQLLCSRILLGIGESFSMPASYSLIADYFPSESLGQVFVFFPPITVSVVCPAGPYPPLRLARRPNRGHTGGGGG